MRRLNASLPLAIVLLALNAGSAAADVNCGVPPVGALQPLGAGAALGVPGAVALLTGAGAVRTAMVPNVYSETLLGGMDVPEVPGMSASAAGALVAWRDTRGSVQLATLGADGTLGAPVAVGTGAVGPSEFQQGGSASPVLVGGSWVLWRATDGDHVVHVSAGAPGPPEALGDGARATIAFAGDASGSAWVVGRASGGISAQRLGPGSAPSPAFLLAGVRRSTSIRVAADGLGGLFVLASSRHGAYWRLQLMHLSASGATRPALVAPSASTVGAVSARAGDGNAVVAYSLVRRRHVNAYLRAARPDGSLRPPRTLSAQRQRDVIVTSVDQTTGGGGVAGVVLARGAHATPASAEFGARGPARLRPYAAPRADQASGVAAVRVSMGTLAAWTYVNPSSQTSSSGITDSGALGGAMSATQHSPLRLASGICSGA